MNCTLESHVTQSGHTYSGVNTFYRPHAHAKELPPDLPLLVFVHGLGGSLAQWNPLLTALVNVAPCLAIDLPGCGASMFSPNDLEAYTPLSLAELVFSAIDRVRNHKVNQKVVLIGHSYGCSLAALLASSDTPLSHLCSHYIIGMVAICPRSSPLSEREVKAIKTLSWIPTPFVALLRMLDRRGGIKSSSVTRMAGKHSDDETRKLQLRFNQMSRTSVWKRMTLAMALSERRIHQQGQSSLLGQRTWEGLNKPLFLIAARDDTVTNPEEAEQILAWVHKDPRIPTAEIVTFASPAAHSLPFSPRTIRSLSGHIENFLAKSSVDHRLGLGWQLHKLTGSAKWDVKNFAKWVSVDPCSAPIASIFRAMKTMRQGDEVHSPGLFVRNHGGEGGVKAVVDISRDQPIYNKDELEAGGIEYHKFPTVSKEVPRIDEVNGFCALVDRLREDLKIGIEDEGSTIGVHCHYGFNRTGFLISSYLIERLKWKVEDAVAEFKNKRPPGIKHGHFIDQLHTRYGAR